jgi:hypothetical protein
MFEYVALRLHRLADALKLGLKANLGAVSAGNAPLPPASSRSGHKSVE